MGWRRRRRTVAAGHARASDPARRRAAARPAIHRTGVTMSEHRCMVPSAPVVRRQAYRPLRRPCRALPRGELPAARLPLQAHLLHPLLVQLPLPDLQHLADAAARRAAPGRDPPLLPALATLSVGRP